MIVKKISILRIGKSIYNVRYTAKTYKVIKRASYGSHHHYRKRYTPLYAADPATYKTIESLRILLPCLFAGVLGDSHEFIPVNS
jgi:hypothetical protein